MEEQKSQNITGQVASGMIWRFMERILAQTVSFVVSIVLARLLDPEHYAVVSMTMIFISIANVFVSEGIGKALVQKHNATQEDFSSVFYVNLSLSILLYIVLFFCAPIISSFYHEPVLVSTLRVLSLRLPLAAVNSIQHAYVARNMQFKLFFKATIVGTVISAGVGLTLAYFGFGVWALVAQYLTNSFIDTIMLWFMVKWRPKLLFNYSRVKGLLRFGASILLSGLINSLYNNLSSFLIGKWYTKSDLAYFTKGKHYPELIITNINSSLGTVLYPAFSKLQKNTARLKEAMKKAIRIDTFIIFPMMVLLFVLSPELVSLLLTDKWLPCVIYIRISCIYLSLYPINTTNLQAIMALGEGRTYLRLNIIKKVIGVVLILCVLPLGVVWVALCEILVSIISVVVNVSANKRLLNYTFKELIVDMGRNLALSLFMAAVMFGAKMLLLAPIGSKLAVIMISGFAGVLFYIAIAYCLKIDELQLVENIILKIVRRKGTSS